MLTRARTSQLQFSRRLGALPLELVHAILDELGACSADLYHCALTCRSWRDHSLNLLYLHLRLVDVSHFTMMSLTTSPALKRHRVKSLSFKNTVVWEEWKELLDNCEGLEELSVKHDDRNSWPFPVDLLQHPNLSKLKVLTLRQTVEVVYPALDVAPTIHFRLRKLVTDIRHSEHPFLEEMVRISLSEETPSLTHLELVTTRNDAQPLFHNNLKFLQPISSTITDLCLPLQSYDVISGSFFPPVTEFLHAAISLRHLTITSEEKTEFLIQGNCIKQVLEETKVALLSFDLAILPSHYSPSIFSALIHTFDDTLAMSELSILKLSRKTLAELEMEERWSDLCSRAETRGVKIATKEML